MTHLPFRHPFSLYTLKHVRAPADTNSGAFNAALKDHPGTGVHTANALGSETCRFLEPYTLVGIIFLAVSLPAAAGLRVFEAWTKRRPGMTK